MAILQVLVDSGVYEIDGMINDDVVSVSPAALQESIGWELKPEGLCRGDMCVPVTDTGGIVHGDRLDLVAAARLTGSETLIDHDASVIAISVPSPMRRQTLVGRQAANFTLPDLDGELHSLAEFAGRRRLLVAFATW